MKYTSTWQLPETPQNELLVDKSGLLVDKSGIGSENGATAFIAVVPEGRLPNDSSSYVHLTKEDTHKLIEQLAEISEYALSLFNHTNLQAVTERAERAERQVQNLEAKLARKDEEFAEQVMSHHEGCGEGKIEFLNHCGLPVPSRTFEVTFTITARSTDDDAVDTNIRYALEHRHDLTDYLEIDQLDNVRIETVA